MAADQSFIALFDLVGRYEQASGAKLNRSKCKSLLVGSWKDRSFLPCDIECSNEQIYTLGYHISNAGIQNWERIIKKLQALLTTWKRRSLSLRGRVIVVKTLGLSLFWFLSSCSIMPDAVLKKINSMIFPFIWGKSREAIKRDTLCALPSEGGLGVTNISDKLFSLLCFWPKRYLLGEPRWWKNFFEHYVRKAFNVPHDESIDAILSRPNYDLKTLEKIPTFYATVLLSWAALGKKSTSPEWDLVRPTGTVLHIRDLSASKGYDIFRVKRRQTPRCVKKYEEWGIPPDNWKHVWQDQMLWKFVRSVQDTNFSIAHAVLPTKDRLIRFKMKVSPYCFCGANESLCHLFSDCFFAKKFLSWFYSVLKLFNSSLNSISPSQILLGISRQTRVPCGFNALLGIIRHRIWLVRNAYVFEGTLPNFEDALVKVKSSFRFLLLMQCRNTKEDYFRTNWLVGNIFGRLDTHNNLKYSDIIK